MHHTNTYLSFLISFILFALHPSCSILILMCTVHRIPDTAKINAKVERQISHLNG